MKVQGRRSASPGAKRSASCSAGEVKTVMSRSSTTAFAMMSRPTQGVNRLEGERFITPTLYALTTKHLGRFLHAAQAGGLTDPFAQVRKLDTRGARRLGKQARGRHARQGIYL